MITLRPHWLLALTLVACTSLDAREPSKPTEEIPEGKTKQGTPDRDPALASAVTIAVASVLLEQDCPDPAPEPAAAPSTPAAMQPAKPTAPGASAPMPPRQGDPPSAVSYRRACQQSTMQLKLTNAGGAEAKIHIASIKLRDVQSNSVLVPVKSRLPSAWNASSTYEAWNERVAGKSEVSASYRLTPPDWSSVESKLGSGVDSHGRQFELEIEVEVDGKPVTVRSPAFTRAPEMVMPPT